MVRLMVIDDARVVRDFVGLMITAASDIELVASVASGAEAISRLSMTTVDVIVVDMHLPDIDGYDLLAILAAEGKYGLVVLSGSVDPRVAVFYPTLASFNKDHLFAERDAFLAAVREAGAQPRDGSPGANATPSDVANAYIIPSRTTMFGLLGQRKRFSTL